MKVPRWRRFTVGWMMIVVAVIAMILGGYVFSQRSGYRQLEVVNRSGKAISHLTITVWGESHKIENLADGSSAMVPFWAGEGTRFSMLGSLNDRTPVSTSIKMAGDPRRFARIIGVIEPGGKFRLSLEPVKQISPVVGAGFYDDVP